MRAAVALSETSEGVLERAGDSCRVREDDLENWGVVDTGVVAMEVLLKVGTALGRGWRYCGGLREGCVILDLYGESTSWSA